MEKKIVVKKSRSPLDAELPSTEQLIKSTILAAAMAGVLLVTVVMPAEYGIDPTGIGNLLGLKKMGEIRVSLDKEAAADQAKDQAGSQASSSGTPAEVPQTEAIAPVVATPQPSATSASTLNHEMEITLAPDEGAEVKVVMDEGKKVQYTWSTNGGKANFDVHADSQELGIDYHQYGKGSEQTDQGEIEAAFNGSHGWFWRNRNSEPIVITLKTQGEYSEIKRVK
jgi:hypothetical protein